MPAEPPDPAPGPAPGGAPAPGEGARPEHVTVLLFAHLRERVGEAELRVALPADRSPAGVLRALLPGGPGVTGPVLFAINEAWAPADAPLQGGDVLALIPPLGGG